MRDTLESLTEKLRPALPRDNSAAAVFAETPTSLLLKICGTTTPGGDRMGVSLKRLESIRPQLTSIISYFRWYPDRFLDFIQPKDSRFRLTPYQRIMLRCIFRHRYVFGTFPRGYSKSFLAILADYLKCILYPNSKVFIVSPGKQQSMSIIQEKIDEIWSIYPALKREVYIGRDMEDSKMQSNIFKLRFKSGSIFDVVACSERSRGLRRTSGIIEEAAKIDGTLLSQVIIPTMNISRRAACGYEDPHDITNKSQIYITSAGDKSSFAYDKMITLLIWSVLRPTESICFGGTWRPPVAFGLLSANFVDDLKADGTYSEATFANEYESQWTGASMDAYFSSAEFDRARVLAEPMFDYPARIPKGALFIMSYDVGRNNDSSVCTLFYLVPSLGSTYTKNVVNIFPFEKMHYRDQATEIKKLMLRFHVSKLIIDANGPGIGLVDFLTVPTVSSIGEELPAMGVDRESDTKEMYRNFYQVQDPEYNGIIWLMRATDRLNSEMHNLCATQIATGKVRFLINDKLAKEQWQRKAVWQTMSEEQRVATLRPYIVTSILKEEMMNLRRKADETSNIVLRKISSRLHKDKFSSLEYGIYYARLLETRKSINTGAVDNLNLSSGGGAAGSFRKFDRGGFRRDGGKFRRG